MSLTYIFLFISVLSCFIVRRKDLTIILAVISTVLAFVQGIIGIQGLLFLGLFYVITAICFHQEPFSHKVKSLLLFCVFCFIGFVVFHMIPGFQNQLVLNKVTFSALSLPFTMYLNFDKVMIALILFLNSGLYNWEGSLSVRSLVQSMPFFLGALLCLFVVGWTMGYVQVDPKVPAVLPLWCLNNLLFVCFAEEVFFRGTIQRLLRGVFSPTGIPYLHILIGAILFGLTHGNGGVFYILLSTLAGIFYGLTYEKTGKVFCAMLVHFGVNLIHILFLTYPATINLLK